MKEIGTTHWISPNTGATNSSGFTGLPGGYRNYDGLFNYYYLYGTHPVGSIGLWWSSTEGGPGPEFAWYLSVGAQYARADINNANKADGFSVRCVRD